MMIFEKSYKLQYCENINRLESSWTAYMDMRVEIVISMVIKCFKGWYPYTICIWFRGLNGYNTSLSRCVVGVRIPSEPQSVLETALPLTW